MLPPEQLLGPLGLTAAAIGSVYVLWRLVREYIDDIRTARDRWRGLAESYETRLDEQTQALAILPTVAATLERIERRLDSRS